MTSQSTKGGVACGAGPRGMEAVKLFIADLARPFAIISTSLAASWGIVVVAYRVHDGNDGALYIAASLAGVGAIYIGKSIEVFKTNRAAAEVEVARVTSGQAAPAAVAAPPADDGELPESQRVRL